MAKPKEIWVLPEISENAEDISKLSLGVLSEARYIAQQLNGTVTALVFSDQDRGCPEVFGQYGVTRAYLFKDSLLKHFSAEAYALALLPAVQDDRPWLFLMGNTTVGKELAPRLAVILETGLVSNCVKMDFSNVERPKFFRPVYEGQLYQEVVFETTKTMLVTMSPGVLNITPASSGQPVKMAVIEPKLSLEAVRVKHVEFLPADFRTVDVTDAEVIVTAGMGAATDELLPLTEELAALIGGAIGTTRPVVDEAKIPRERMIGQTGKVVSPDFYLALGISGSVHHIGGIKDSGTIVAINREPNAPVFQNSDVGIIADLKDILPELIAKIKRAERGSAPEL
ncbi:MAG TPA: electron transfer flavoprotein subunit alpha/FixB family protein [Dehalococcoidia bacterium]|nr:electron transfer flavoprotein subunit alpha/FixB family protein [Dehalococcoidia bacterium]